MARPGREVAKPDEGAVAPERVLQRLAPRLGGARVVYGKPVRNGEVTVIPVATVRGGIGFGYGHGTGGAGDEGGGGGGGSGLHAKPVGYIEVTPAGARFHRIADVEGTLRAVGRAAVGLAIAATILRRGERGWRPRAYAALLTRRK
jgi:uncharacterized spore protein YtfJ